MVSSQQPRHAWTRRLRSLLLLVLTSAVVASGGFVLATPAARPTLGPSTAPYASLPSARSRSALSAPSASSARPLLASGTIRGRVELRHPLPVVERRPNVADLGSGGRRDVSDRLLSVVYLDSAPRGAFEQPEAGHAIMNQRNETFVPHVLAIGVGTTVDFPNGDRIFHNVFSLSKPAPFDLGRYAAGRSKSVRFDRPGIVRVFCEIHSHMSAFILVFGHPFFTTTDAEGRFRLDNVPAGTYNLVAWNEGTSSDPATVIVPSGGTAERDLAVR